MKNAKDFLIEMSSQLSDQSSKKDVTLAVYHAVNESAMLSQSQQDFLLQSIQQADFIGGGIVDTSKAVFELSIKLATYINSCK